MPIKNKLDELDLVNFRIEGFCEITILKRLQKQLASWYFEEIKKQISNIPNPDVAVDFNNLNALIDAFDEANYCKFRIDSIQRKLQHIYLPSVLYDEIPPSPRGKLLRECRSEIMSIQDDLLQLEACTDDKFDKSEFVDYFDFK